MATQDLYAQIEGLQSFAETHADVASAMTGLLSGTPHAAGVESTHGPIASAVHEALGGTLEARAGVHRTVSGAADQLSESLKKAAQRYEQVDQHAAAAVRKAEEAIGGSGGPGAPSSPGGDAPSGAAAGEAEQLVEQVQQGHPDKADDPSASTDQVRGSQPE